MGNAMDTMDLLSGMKGCDALAKLAESNAENQAGIVQADGILAVVAALRGHPTNADVQFWGDAALAEREGGGRA